MGNVASMGKNVNQNGYGGGEPGCTDIGLDGSIILKPVLRIGLGRCGQD